MNLTDTLIQVMSTNKKPSPVRRLYRSGLPVQVRVGSFPPWVGVIVAKASHGRGWLVRRAGYPDLWDVHKSYLTHLPNQAVAL